MVQVFTEGKHNAEFLISEANGTLSREVGTLDASAGALTPGTLLGRVTATAKLKAYSNAASDGSETCVGVLYAHAPDLAVDQKVTYIARSAEVRLASLTGLDTAARTDLAALHIAVR